MIIDEIIHAWVNQRNLSHAKQILIFKRRQGCDANKFYGMNASQSL